MKHLLHLHFATVITLTIAGCGSGMKLVPVAGTVTLDGEPLVDAEVVFRPESGRPSLGVTDSKGHFELRYSAEQKGALAGKHRVAISTAPDGAERDGDGPPSPRERVPARYNSQSSLEVELDAGRSKPLNFALLSQ